MSPLDGLFPTHFKGVSFNVTSEKDGQGREGDIKTFPQRDGARVRDWGLGKREISVEVYISAFTNSAVAATAFRAAMLSPGLGFLSLSNAIIPRALCTGCERAFARDKIGQVHFTLKFVADDEAASIPGLAALGAAIATAAGGILSRLPGIIAPPGASPAFAGGVSAGLAAMAGVVRVALPAITTVATLESLSGAAATIPVRAVPGEAAAAETIAKGA